MNSVSSPFNALAVRLRPVLALTLLVSVATLSAAERDALKLLMIGNSYADYPTANLPAMARAGGKSIVMGRANPGGFTLERHADYLRKAEAGDTAGGAYDTTDPATGQKRRMTLPELLAAQPWDIVTIQQASQLSFKPETYQPFADELIAAVRRHAPTAEIVVQETWAYREDHDLFKKGDGFTSARMYEGLRATYRTFADGKGFRIIPTGDALDLARRTPRWTYVPDPDFDFKNPAPGHLPDQRTSLHSGWHWAKDKQGRPVFRNDASHTNAAGKYLGTCVWYMTLFNTDDVPTDYLPRGLAPEDAADLRVHAGAAVQAERARKASLPIAE